MLADHIVKGPTPLWPPGSRIRTDEWLEAFLRMSQYKRREGPLVARALYTVPFVRLPATVLPLVREVTWDRLHDRDRTRRREVRWPTVKVAFYGLHREELPSLESLVMDLDVSLSKLPAAVEGLNLDYMFGDKNRMDQEITFELKDHAPNHRSLERATFINIRLKWVEGNLTELDRHWLAVWEALTSACRDDRRIDGMREDYMIAPRRFAQLLTASS